jgi:spore germination protein GerM
MHARRTLGVTVAVTLILAAACGDDDDASTAPTSPSTASTADGTASSTTASSTSTTTTTTASASTTTTAPGETVAVYLLSEGNDCASTEVVHRPATPGTDPLGDALAQLVAGPTPEEDATGHHSWFSAETADLLTGAWVADGIAHVAFSSGLAQVIPNASSSCGSAGLLAQLDATVHAVPGVTGAVYSFDGVASAFSEWLQLAPPDGVVDDPFSPATYYLEDAEVGEGGPFLVPVDPGAATWTPFDAVVGLATAPTAGDADLSSAVPAATRAHGVTIADGVATVDLSEDFASGGGSASMLARLGQLVFTLTRFPGVDAVALELDGQPVDVFSAEGLVLDGPLTRAWFDDTGVVPPVLVDEPASGATVVPPFRLAGVAHDVFEATFEWRITTADIGTVTEGFVTTSGQIGWSTFDEIVGGGAVGAGPVRAGLTVFVVSAETGAVVWQRTYPVELAGVDV